MVLEVVRGAGADHEVERFPQPAGQVADGRFGDRGGERGGLGGIDTPLGRRFEHLVADAAALADEAAQMQGEERQAYAEQRRFDVLHPVAGQVPDHVGVGDHAAVDEGEEGERQCPAPEERRAEEQGGEDVQFGHRWCLPRRFKACNAGTRSRPLVSFHRHVLPRRLNRKIRND